MKKTIYSIIIVAMLLTTFINCQKEDDDNTAQTALLFLLADQASGNCATVSKSTSTTGLYTAFISTVPKGGCNLVTTRQGLIDNFTTQQTNLKAVYDRAGSNCSTQSAAITTSLSNINTLFATTTDATVAASAANQRIFTVGNLVTETTNTLRITYSAEQVAAMSPGTLDDLWIFSANNGTTAGSACRTSVQALNPALFSNPPTKIAFSSCQYGSAAASTQRCASLNTEF